MSYRRRFARPWDEVRARHFGGHQPMPVPPPPPEPFQFPDLPSIEMPGMPEFPAFPAPFDPNAAAEKQKRADEINKLKDIETKRKGYASTLLTGGQGDTTDPAVKRPSLLGT